jgi:gamma-glutamylaminecyclotransferase
VRIFVYGTLLRGERYHDVLGGAALVSVGRTAPGFQLVDLGEYPALVRGGEGSVVGEVYDVDDATLAALDQLEDHPRLYQRTSLVLAVGGVGGAVEAYLLSAERAAGLPTIESGSWRERASRRLR